MNEFRLLFQIFLIFVLFSGIYVIFWVHSYSESFSEGLTSGPNTSTTGEPSTSTSAPQANTPIPQAPAAQTPAAQTPAAIPKAPVPQPDTKKIDGKYYPSDAVKAELEKIRKGKNYGKNLPLSDVYHNQAANIYPDGNTNGSYMPPQQNSADYIDDNNGQSQNDSKTGEQNLDDYVLNQHPVSLASQKDNRENNVYSGTENDFLPSVVAYPDSPYSPFDPLNEDINHYEYVAKEFASSQPTGLSDNPMDPNWGGVKYTQDVIQSGKYNENNISRPLLFQPKGLYVDAVPSAFGKPKDIIE